MKNKLMLAISRAKFAAIGAAIGGGLGGLINRNAASTGAATGALIGAIIGEKSVAVSGIVSDVKERKEDVALPRRS